MFNCNARVESMKIEVDVNLNSNINSNNNQTQQGSNITNSNNTNQYQHQNFLFDNILYNSHNSNPNIPNYLNDRILPFNNNHTLCQSNAPKSFLQNLKNYSPKKVFSSTSKNTRILPKLPERVLDAPEFSDDFYLNLLDWSSKNVLAIVLGSSIYLWNAETGQNTILNESVENVCSINWMNSGTCLAVGLENGAVELWDTNKNECLRTMAGHSDRVTALSWNEYMLSSGSKDSKIFNHDVRIQSHITSTFLGHKYEVCGLKWSPDGIQLASGGGDNKICIWDVNKSSSSSNINALLHEIDHDLINDNDGFNNRNINNFNNISNNNINSENNDNVINDNDTNNISRSYPNLNTDMQSNVNVNDIQGINNLRTGVRQGYSNSSTNLINLNSDYLQNQNSLLRNVYQSSTTVVNNIGSSSLNQSIIARHVNSLRNLGIYTYLI